MEQALLQGRHQEAAALPCDRIDDLEWLRCLQTQNSQAFMLLYEQFHRQVFRFLVHMTGSRHEAEELLQGVFTTVWEGMNRGMFERFDIRRGTLEGYLLGIARNAARRLIARRDRTISVDHLEYALAAEDDGLEAVEQRFELERLRRAIVQLPVKYREAITLCCLQDLSYEDAARVMQCSAGTVGSRVSRGKKLLRRALAATSRTAQMPSGEAR